MKDDDIKERIKKFLQKPLNRNHSFKEIDSFSYFDDLLALANEYPDNKSLYVEYRHLVFFDSALADELIENPTIWLEQATHAIADTPIPLDKVLRDVTMRVVGLPAEMEIPISQLRHNHMGKFVVLRGIINKATKVHPAFQVIGYKCLRCGHYTHVYQPKDVDSRQEPFAGCEGETCGKKGPFNIEIGESVTYDKQIMQVQEPFDNLRGRQPVSIELFISDKLAGLRGIGEKVIVTGILNTKAQVNRQGQKSQSLDWRFIVNSIELSDTDYENLNISEKDIERITALSQQPDIKQIIIQSIAPSISGWELVKEGLALQQFSGVRTQNKDGTHVRGDIHVLLLGDPGIAKSIMLEFIEILAPRSVMTSGRSASAAGLTGAAVQDSEGKWLYEAGALTMANKGICIIDEIDKMHVNDRASIHQALEQQKISAAKAGIIAELPAECSVLGAGNPKYTRYDPYESIISQFNMDAALLDRIDLIYVQRDIPNILRDSEISTHILWGDDTEPEGLLDTVFLRKYIAHARMTVFPVLTEEAKQEIHKIYVTIRNEPRKASEKDRIPISIRFLRTCIRLTVANAKLRLSEEADGQDAREAIRLLLANLKEVGIDPETGQLDSAVLEFGVSSSQQKRIRELTEIIERLCEKSTNKDKSARVEDVFSESLKQGIRDPDKLLAKMSERGTIIKSSLNHVKLI